MWLEAAGQQLEARKAPLKSSWRQLGGSKSLPWSAPGGALEAPGAVLEALGDPRRHPGHPGGRPGGVLGALGAPLEASKRRPGGSLGRLGAVLGALEAMLEPPGSQKAFKMEPGRVPNRGPQAIRIESAKS